MRNVHCNHLQTYIDLYVLTENRHPANRLREITPCLNAGIEITVVDLWNCNYGTEIDRKSVVFGFVDITCKIGFLDSDSGSDSSKKLNDSEIDSDSRIRIEHH